ncbi:MAG: aminoacyl--tRNA ligase-related protein [Patescibacteria group bacterium]
MKQSELFTKTERNAPKDELTINAKLLTRAGFVEKLMAGVYSYLPLGLRVLRKIEQVVREEMNRIGAQEILMPILHPKDIWAKTGGWENIDVLFKVPSRTEKEYALGQSEEEVVTPLVMRRVQTHKDLPLMVYQIHWKYRDELRAKSGLLRGREFFMKDMYSFHEDQKDFDRFYEVAKGAYFKIFERLGLIAKATEASGGSFSKKISYEFMILTDAGEADILYCHTCEFCVNKEIAKQNEKDPCAKCHKGKLHRAKASEVGNVFDLGDKYGRDFKLDFVGRDGERHYPIMGCYGIGISRLMGTLVETNSDDRGIIWPEAAAPFAVHLLELGDAKADDFYRDLQAAGIEVLYDDRNVSAGEKFIDADLIGIPYRAVISPKTKDKVEVKKRAEDASRIMGRREFINLLRRPAVVDFSSRRWTKPFKFW